MGRYLESVAATHGGKSIRGTVLEPLRVMTSMQEQSSFGHSFDETLREPLDEQARELEEGDDEEVWGCLLPEEQGEEQQADEQQAQEQLTSDREALRRALRDLEAAEARVKRNAERAYEEARASLVPELFDVLDNLDRSIEAARARSDPALLEGVQMVRKQLDDILVRFGAERIDATGGRFDPNVQEAVSSVSARDPEQHMTVLEQISPGYRFGNRLLRPAKVVVAVGPS